jgi:GT2 family glycosyltransferase
MRDNKPCRTQCADCRDATGVQRYFAGRVTAVVGISKYMLDLHRRWGLFQNTPIRRVIHDAYEPPHAVEPSPTTGRPLRLGYLGRIDPLKGIDLLLQTLTTELGERDWTLVLGGRGDPAYEGMLKARYADPRVRFMGFVTPSDLLSQIDVLVVPSLWEEPLGRVWLEAYGHAVPVVGSRRGGIPEGIEDGKTGLVFDPDKAGSLASALGTLMSDAALVDRMKREARGKWAREFTPQSIARQYRDVYAAVTRGPSASPGPGSNGSGRARPAGRTTGKQALTVMIATRNGATTLPRVLDAYQRLDVTGQPWKLVVIDNGSTDGTPAIVRSHANGLPLVVVTEPRGGKNAALNTGLAHREGDLVVFSDDDVIPDPGWLSAMREAADRNPDFTLFGGAVRPLWPAPPSEWLLRLVHLGAAYAITDPALPEGPVAPGLVWGPNMAVRAGVFDAGLRFDEGIGPNGTDYAMGSEVAFNRTLAAHGYRAWFTPAAVVHHIIRPNQIEAQWLLGRAYRSGRGNYLADRQKSSARMPEPSELLRALWPQVRVKCREARSLRGADPAARFKADWDAAFLRGYFREANLARRQDRTNSLSH